MFSYLLGRIDPQKLAVRLVEIDHIAVRIGNENAVVDIVQDEFKESETFFQRAIVATD
jgi:hypothetical protein